LTDTASPSLLRHSAAALSSAVRAHLHTYAKALSRTWLWLAALLLWSGLAQAYVPPPIQGAVTDPGQVLTDSERFAVNSKVRKIKEATGREITVFLPTSLEDNTVEDVAYATSKAWGLATTGHDQGALLVIATKERKIRIETAKGSGGGLTDLESNAIIREQIAPEMKAGRVANAVLVGTQAIADAMAKEAVVKPPAKPLSTGAVAGGLLFLALLLLVPFLLVVLIARFFWRLSTRGPGVAQNQGYRGYDVSDRYDNSPSIFIGGSSWSSGDSSSSSSDSSWSDSSGRDGDWGGGGGDWGGGGSSGDY
jgi:uncharacterized protein